MARLLLLTGYTAVGKTELSLKLAEALNAEILSCDSVQIYRCMDIGSAKPSKADCQRIKHHGIDMVDIHDKFDIQQYVDYALGVMADVAGRGKNLLIVGGSGFYLKSFYYPVMDDVAIPEDVRAKVQMLYHDFGLDGLVRKINELSGDALGNLDMKNPRRIARALERCLVTGRTVEENVAGFMSKSCPFSNHRKITVLLTRNCMGDRVRARIIKMIEDGLIDEVKHLMEIGIESNRSAARAIGYGETIAFIKSGSGDLDRLIDSMVRNTHRLIRKQRTWFKRQIPVDLEICLDDYSIDESFDLIHMFLIQNYIWN
ncbi:MAG: tRNA (adenosine(37)-N6)-dimethylallyltransferase MiaA [Puniceicoccales bacterium]|jgi:tRNA dimethylallyltransferase|nr:tRNA (adenosine(37)-N6)-dimethylallyltransferase MiaA [Puniceicoccales bacterium]